MNFCIGVTLLFGLIEDGIQMILMRLVNLFQYCALNPMNEQPQVRAEYSDYIVKVVVFGQKRTGKTNLLSRLCYDDYTGSYRETVGIDFMVKTVTISERRIKLQFWDVEVTTKSETDKIRSLCCEGMIAAIVVYSITDGSSFDAAQKIILSIQKGGYFTSDVVKILVGNKLDLREDRKVDVQRAQSLADSHKMEYFEASAKDSEGIQAILSKLGTKIYAIIQKNEN